MIGISRIHILLFCLWLFLPQWKFSSKRCKQNKFESHNSLKLSFTNIWDLCRSNSVECESFLESNSSDIFTHCGTPGWLDWFWKFFCEEFLSSYNQKGFYYSYTWPCSLHEGLYYAPDVTLENSMASYLCFRLAVLHAVSFFFFLYQSPSFSLCMIS